MTIGDTLIDTPCLYGSVPRLKLLRESLNSLFIAKVLSLIKTSINTRMPSRGQAAREGVTSDPITDVPKERLWGPLVDKVYHPDRYIPVDDVTTEEKGDHVWRRMHYCGEGIMKDKDIVENIYLDKDHDAIRFVALDPEGKEKDEEIINEVVEDDSGKPCLHYYLRLKSTGQPLHWNAPAHINLKDMEKVVDAARRRR